MDRIKVAAVCMHSETGEIEENLRKTETFVSQASETGATMICFPELSVSGYTLKEPDRKCPAGMFETVKKRILMLARDHGVVVSAGMIETVQGERPFISHLIAGPRGLLGVYRKSHLSPQEKAVYSAGRRIEVLSFEGAMFGLQLCYEAHFPEISTIMSLKGASVIFIPHASPRGTPREKIRSWLRHLRARAFDNAVFIVACNQIGDNGEGLFFPGGAVVVDPKGRVAARYEVEQEGILTAVLDLRTLREIRSHRMKYFLPYRRPELYGEIISGPENNHRDP